MVDKTLITHADGWKKRVDELTAKGMLNKENQETMKQMIVSPDKENFILAQEILKFKMSSKLVEGLNEGQTIAFAEIVEFFNTPTEDALVLKGYAGTGKTFLVKRIIEYIANAYPNRKIAVTAPTNKAVRVLEENAPFNSQNTEALVFDNLFHAESRLQYKTIHKLLGLTEQITDKGEQVFVSSTQDKNEILNFSYLIVDEVSMLDDKLCTDILSYADKVRVLFMGDPCQIPPINKADCIPFSKNPGYNFRMVELTEIMRQKADNPIIAASFQLRNNLTVSQPIPHLKTELNDKGEGITFYDATKDRPKIRPILNEMFNCEAFKENANHAKVIAWRNKTVDYMNSIIREILYGKDAVPFVVGEKLIAHKPIFQKGISKWGPRWDIQFYTSEEMVVETVTLGAKKFDEGGFQLNMKCWQLKVKAYDTSLSKYYTSDIIVMHDDEVPAYDLVLKDAKDKAIRTREKQNWINYYNIMKWSAPVAYNYAISAHKSQGSTYTKVLLMEEDIDFNKRIIERNRIKYTSYTRPTSQLYILRNNYNKETL